MQRVPAVQLVRGAGLLGQLPRREVPRAADVGRVGVARARERLELAEGLVAVERRHGVVGRQNHESVPRSVDVRVHLQRVWRRPQAGLATGGVLRDAIP